MSDWEPFKTSLREDLKCGFIGKDALEIVESLSPQEVKRLAAMAVTCFESQWSDRGRDLVRGVSCLLGRLPHGSGAK